MALAFDIAGPIAMFRRPYTTTSSVSFPIPPPTAVAGLLAAIVGIENGSHEDASAARYWDELKGTQIALSILNPIAWFTGTINLWNVKEPQKSPHIRVKHQFVKNPKYRIYVHGGLEKALQKHLEMCTFIYTPCLGTAYALGDITYVGAFDKQPVSMEKKVAISSVLPLSSEHTVELDIVASGGIFRDKLPYRLTGQRAFSESITVLYSAYGKIFLNAWEGLDVTYYGDECIAWFPAW